MIIDKKGKLFVEKFDASNENLAKGPVFSNYIYPVFPRLIPHPRLVPQCGTIQIQTMLNSMFILTVTHLQIIPHDDSVKNRILLLKNYKITKQSTRPNKLSSKLPCSQLQLTRSTLIVALHSRASMSAA